MILTRFPTLRICGEIPNGYKIPLTRGVVRRAILEACG